MEKKTITIVFLVFAFVFGLMFWGRSLQNNALSDAKPVDGAKTALTVEGESFFDFGNISMKNGKVSTVFTVANRTDKEIFLKSVTTSCMCTEAYLMGGKAEKGPFKMPGMGFVPLANETILPGETRTIKTVFDPNAHGPAGVGPIERVVRLVEENGGSLEFGFKAKVTP
ncbi:MAG: DUF1573 domain-containing protein [Candidatus Paceibacterota bacterium]|jgi:hypothetical protein|nr:DUF1573 domain-containing protein [Candidatus Paceibacterota bacterium]